MRTNKQIKEFCITEIQRLQQIPLKDVEHKKYLEGKIDSYICVVTELLREAS
jgi:hypothetical protein